MSVVAELSNVTVDYAIPTGSVRALDSVSLVVEANSSLAIVGRSGSGKSTLVSVLGLLRQPSAGSVTMRGENVNQLSRRARDLLRARCVGVAFQTHHLDPSLTATENVILPWVFSSGGMSRVKARERARLLLDSLGVEHLSRNRPGQMSGGQRQRVALARAMFNSPPLLIADEPTGNLDEDSAQEASSAIYSLPGLFGTAVVVVTHDHAVARGADRVVRISRARTVEE